MKTAMIRKALLSTLAASAVMVATSALAQNVSFSIGVGSPGYSQPYGYGHRYNRGYGHDLQIRAERLEQRIDRLAWNGRISRREAQTLGWRLQEFRSLEWRYARDGLSRREYADLSYRLDRIERQLRHERRDRW